MPTITASALQDFATKLLAAGGALPEEAACVAESLVGANLRGYDSHGVMRLPYYIAATEKKEVNPGAELAILADAPALVVADGNWGYGQVQARRLLTKLMDKAKASGVAVGTMKCSSHIGRLGEYCDIAAEQQLVTILMVNSHGAARRVAPPGGKVARLGTNPLAIGVPLATGPLVLDFSTSATAEGKVRVKNIAGEKCPEGWLIDKDGNPTCDPSVLYNNPPGSILPFGGNQGFKGFGLGMMIDIFTGALSGGLCSREKPETQIGNCVYMQVINPNFFGGTEHFAREVMGLATFIRNCPRVDGVDEIILPGDPERKAVAKRMAEGITLDAENWKALLVLADRLKVPAPAL